MNHEQIKHQHTMEGVLRIMNKIRNQQTKEGILQPMNKLSISTLMKISYES